MTASSPASTGGTRRVVTRLALAAVLVLLVTFPAGTARAHDVLVGAKPADGAVLTDAPSEVVLTFSGEVLELSPVIVVTDGSGTVVADADGAAQVDGRDVKLPLPAGLPPGEYDVQWRVVSSDGHPIEGLHSFRVAGATGGGDVGSPAAGPTTEPASAPVAAGKPADEEPSHPHEPAGGLQALPMWLKIALVIAATGAVAGIVVLAARQWRETR